RRCVSRYGQVGRPQRLSQEAEPPLDPRYPRTAPHPAPTPGSLIVSASGDWRRLGQDHPPSVMGRPSSSRFERFLLHRFLHLLRGYVAYVRAYGPVMAERVLELTVAIAPEHVCDRHGDLRAGLNRAGGKGIGIVHVEMDRDRGALERLRAQR